MKIYRVENRYTQPESCGFSYYTQKADALKELAKNKNSDMGVEIQEMDIELNKAGVMKVLDLWASHPDNG